MRMRRCPPPCAAARRTDARCTCAAWSPTAACTATTRTCTRFWRWRNASACATCMCTALLDGRDVPPDSGAGYVRALEEKIGEIGVGRIASVCGRYYAMDRDNRWDRVEKAYDAIVRGIGAQADSAPEAVERSYAAGVTDEFVLPVRCPRRRAAAKGRQLCILQLPARPGAGADAGHCRPGLFGFRPRIHPGALRLHDPVRRDHAGRVGRLPAPEPQQHARPVPVRQGADPAAHRRDREVRARYVLLQRRARTALSGRGPRAHPLAEGRDLRPQA